MASGISAGHHCCPVEKKQLMVDLCKCDFNSNSYEEHHNCYREAAKKSKKHTRACMYS